MTRDRNESWDPLIPLSPFSVHLVKYTRVLVWASTSAGRLSPSREESMGSSPARTLPWLLHICMPSVSLLGKRGGLAKSRPQLLQHSQWESLLPGLKQKNWKEVYLERTGSSSAISSSKILSAQPAGRSVESERKRFVIHGQCSGVRTFHLQIPLRPWLYCSRMSGRGKGKRKEKKKLVMKGGKWTKAKNLHFLNGSFGYVVQNEEGNQSVKSSSHSTLTIHFSCTGTTNAIKFLWQN